MGVEFPESGQRPVQEGIVVEGVVERLADPRIVEEVGGDGVRRGKRAFGDIQVEPDMDRLEQQTTGVDIHPVRPLDIGEEGRIRLDRIEFAGAQPQHPDIGIGADFNSDGEVGRGAPIVIVDIQQQVLVAVPRFEAVRTGADHVRGHELIRPTGDHAAIGLDRILADDGRNHRDHHRVEEAGARLLQGDLECGVVDDPGLGNDVAESVGSALRKVHCDDPIPGELDVMGGQRAAVVEPHTGPDRERVGEPVG